MNRRPFLAGLFACFALVALVVLARADQTVLYEKASAYNTIVVTEEENGLRALRFGKGGARQSVVKLGDPDYLALPYARVALVGLALCEEPRRILVVGLGGGTLPMFLRKHYPDATIDAVDIDPAVVDVAKKFFGFREDKLMRAHVADGRQFIEQSRQPYDAIFLDAFGSDNVPAHLTTQEFLRAVRRTLKPDGVVVGNVWGRHSNPLYDSMVRTYQEVFDELFILDVQGAGNMILLALPRRQPLNRDELAQLARKVSTAKRFRLDLGDLVNDGFLHAQEKNQRGRVLRDRELNERQLNVTLLISSAAAASEAAVKQAMQKKYPDGQRVAGAIPAEQLGKLLEGLALFALLWWFSIKPRRRGAVSALFLIGYGVFRFSVEYTREPDGYLGLLAFGLSMGQWLSLPMIAAGVALLAWSHRNAPRRPA